MAMGSRKGDLIERGDVLEILHKIKNDDDTPKNYGTILDAIRKVRNIPTKIHIHKTCRGICDKYHETCFMVEYQGDCEYCGHQIFKAYIIDTLKGENND